MSGTSGDGIDASVINSDGTGYYKVLINKYFKYSDEISENIHNLKRNINKIDDVKKFSKEINSLDRKITLFHSNVVSSFTKNQDIKIDLIGFHGQTILHNPKNKYSKQLGNGNLLSQLSKKKVIYNFRQNDLFQGGEGAPLSPIFHQIIVKEKKINLPVCILNIGGISNITVIEGYTSHREIYSKDIGPGNCLIDAWVRNNSKKKFDKNGQLADIGNVNEIIYEQAQDLYTNRIDKNKASYDTSDFDLSFARGLSLEDGAATITNFTGSIIANSLMKSEKENSFNKVLICGGGRKNKILLNTIKKNISKKIEIELIDNYQINGDFVESQAFGYLAVRSFKKLPITFPNTTNCKIPSVGGEIIGD